MAPTPRADRGPQPAPPEEEMKQGLWAPQHGCWHEGPGAAGSELASASGPVALSSRAVCGRGLGTLSLSSLGRLRPFLWSPPHGCSQPGVAWHPHLPHRLHVDTQDR